ncbi:MAG: YdcH family protein, partial [Alphaproteobacteria bacterium]|nr:YdcH family protein [Alphaproteobacteria bacterium]
MNQNSLIEQLESLQVEHEVLDREITELTAGGVYDDIRISRLKKRKLALKDQ